MVKVKKNRFWQNTIKKYRKIIPHYTIPETIHDIAAVILQAEKENRRVKAVGSGHSFSDVAMPDHYLVDLRLLNKVLELPNFIKEEKKDRTLVHVEAGITIQKFNCEMDDRDLCITNMGGIDEQTLAGAISTGTHGTGIDLPSLPGLVQSMVLVTKNGKMLRIEPTNGITDPAKHNEIAIELRQDDDLFYSALVNLGCFGIIYSYILKIEEMYYLKETKECFKWKDIKPKLEDRSIFFEEDGTTPIRGVMVQINPYKTDKDDHTVIVVKHRLLKSKPKRNINDRKRNWLSSLFGNFPLVPFSFLVISKKIVRKPSKLPSLLDSSLKSLRDKSFENKGYKVLYQGVEYLKVRAYDSEFAFDLAFGKNNFIAAIERMFELVEYNQARGFYQSSPMGIRFVNRSKAYLSPEYAKQVAYIDVPFVCGTPGSDDFLYDYQKIMLDKGGIPHWGKINSILNGKPEVIKEYYPELPKWEKVFKEFNENKTFSNQFSDRLKLGFICVEEMSDLEV
ncbi:MAG: hypothetical protein CMO01_28470 [Thalassobius sp.]|nr:hypothetical protein [Thalassovita sp.]